MWVRLVDFLYQNGFKHEIQTCRQSVCVYGIFRGLRIKDTFRKVGIGYRVQRIQPFSKENHRIDVPSF